MRAIHSNPVLHGIPKGTVQVVSHLSVNSTKLILQVDGIFCGLEDHLHSKMTSPTSTNTPMNDKLTAEELPVFVRMTTTIAVCTMPAYVY